MRLLRHDDPYVNLFDHYQDVLMQLEGPRFTESTLRYFEKHLLKEIGYGLPLSHDVTTGGSIDPDLYYRYVPGRGFMQVSPCDDPTIFLGSTLIGLRDEALITTDALRQAKRLMRMVLARHLGEKPLHSRALL